ncbi:enoyl-CoA hydratase-related protein [Variovorax saccharolyticus]|uniref:enoyl-CoA hydratase-related protein n=1 Tax=Variovorax saccharolyticus TaxID=3053516 RepID=UPI002578D9ED|nr:enoyl-CoA hydratase-related protein [Variovorax sp. J31P216]MDM0028355.1 enoyl-CoA hydratase-related protein [Variovorax sp. J31P216]
MNEEAEVCLLDETRPEGAVALLRLNRPSVLNALNLSLRRQLAAAVVRLDSDASIRVIVLCGNERAFCAGADLNEYANATPPEIIARDMDRLWGAIAACRKPVVAAVRGYALGGGCELAMHSDVIIAGESARFGQPEVRIGLMPGGGATQRLTRAVGKFRAMALLMSGAQFGASEALRMGLVSEMVADSDVEERALSVARDLAALPVLALRFIKRAVLDCEEGTLSQGLELERRSFQLLFSTSDKTEGIQARLDKRSPRFS